MKKESPFWSSISLLIGIVIAILALIRGRMRLPLLLAVFALWLLWWLLTQALPLWRNNRAYRAKEARLREQTAAANGGGQLADALLCHVNYRITAMLHAAYPNARWEWLADKPFSLPPFLVQSTSSKKPWTQMRESLWISASASDNAAVPHAQTSKYCLWPVSRRPIHSTRPKDT